MSNFTKKLLVVLLLSVVAFSCFAATKKTADYKYEYVYTYAGYEIEIEVHNGYGFVTYPKFITDDELGAAAYAFTSAYGTNGITYKKTAPGKLYVTFPKGLSKSELDYFASVASSGLTWYLDQLFAPAQEENVIQAEESDEELLYVYYLTYGPYEAIVCLGDGFGYVIYPAEISQNDIEYVINYFYQYNKSLMSGMTFKFVSPESFRFTFPKGLSENTINYYAEICINALGKYLESIF